MKRPSSRKDEAEDGEPETKKKPAASGSMNKAINELKHGLRSSSSKKDEDDNEEESGGEEEESHLRDKGKSIKFNSMRRSLPAHIIHLYDTEALSKPSPREFRTQVIHQLFTKWKNLYSLNAEKPMFQEAKKLYKRKYGKDSETGLPKSVLKGFYFQNIESSRNRKDCVLLSTTLNYSQQVFQLLLSTSLSPTLSTYSLNHHPVTHFGLWNTKNTDHRLNQCSIDNISIISYIQKTYNTIFNKDC